MDVENKYDDLDWSDEESDYRIRGIPKLERIPSPEFEEEVEEKVDKCKELPLIEEGTI